MQRLKNNQSILKKIRSAENIQDLTFLILGILSWLGFSYLFILYIKISQGGSIYKFPWHWDAPLWAFAESLIGAWILIGIKHAFGLLSEKLTRIKRDFLVLILTTPIIAFLLSLINLALNLLLGFSYTGGEKPLSYDFVMGFLHAFILQTFVSSTCIGYFYLTLVNQTKEKLAQAQRAKSEMELQTLRQNIEPHFLFNNLNVLSSLIETNPAKANEFLDKLAQLYRYVLHTNNAEVVSLKDEIEFAGNYSFLLEQRFGTAYHFKWEIGENAINGQMIVPTALQNLLENVVKHNAGRGAKPLRIRIKMNENSLTVENQLSPKIKPGVPSGTGLQNLRDRYALLTDEKIRISSSEKLFTVVIPLLKTRNESNHH